MHHQLTPHNVCPREITFDLDGDIVHNLAFRGGCPGNLQALSRACEGMTVGQIEHLFTGIDCGGKGTSCSDQLALLVRSAYEKQQETV